ncbi:MAG: methyltransferase domain-containing protein [Coriobacteriales bacterium]|jgi:ubiquinone/menaquinone biosynthesis C-methylase UbiE|nr:methyltransferase domain-containing protein [Coriobacteriales bacterium]
MADQISQYYQELASQPDLYELGLLNATEEPIPRHARLIRDELVAPLRQAAFDGKAAKTAKAARPMRSFYGFYTPLPSVLSGCKVLLLGCGTGRDAFIASKLVGAHGSVLAVDTDAANIKTARSYSQEQMELFGRKHANIQFSCGYPEDMASFDAKDRSFDVVLLNYSFNLALDKKRVISEVWRVLRFGGELYLGALFANCRMSTTYLNDHQVRNRVVRGAVYLEDFRRWLRAAGWESFRYMEKRRVVIQDKHQAKELEGVDLTFRVIRAFKLDNLEDLCENYGQSAEYLGTMPGFNQFFDLDDKHRFYVDKPIRVCGNTCALVENTRFAQHFRIQGNRQNRHFGLYTYCPYCGFGKDEDDIIEYLEEGKEVCTDCSHKAFCTVDGHCQHEG